MQIVEAGFEIVSPFYGAEMLKRIEAAGRTCYKSEDKITANSAQRFVKMIIDRGHHSVLEHESVSVRIVCDRGISHEIVRHRLASYSQESTRYCNYAKGGGEITFIMPEFEHEAPRALWRAAMETSELAYLTMVDKLGIPPQIARSVLPNSLKTEIVMTANLREWRHFFKLRCAKAAHPQMRSLACKMLAEFQDHIRVVFDGLSEEVSP